MTITIPGKELLHLFQLQALFCKLQIHFLPPLPQSHKPKPLQSILITLVTITKYAHHSS